MIVYKKMIKLVLVEFLGQGFGSQELPISTLYPNWKATWKDQWYDEDLIDISLINQIREEAEEHGYTLKIKEKYEPISEVYLIDSECKRLFKN